MENFLGSTKKRLRVSDMSSSKQTSTFDYGKQRMREEKKDDDDVMVVDVRRPPKMKQALR
jgi:phosphoribosylaminoimidazole carboxylase (NCAIR synthetase)